MSVTLKSPVGILNICELILTIICVGLIGGLACLRDDIYRIQFISAIVCGFIIVDIITVASIFAVESIDRYVRLLIAGFGSILWLCASALLLEAGDARECGHSGGESYDRAIAAGILGLASCVTRGADGFFVYKGMES